MVRVMCSGRVDPAFVIRAFQKGNDAVFIGGCKLNECNYTTHGNFHALNMTLLLKRIMEHIGLNPDRLRLAFMSGAEANVFTDHVNNFVKEAKQLGPIGKLEGIDRATLAERLDSVAKLIPYIKRINKDKLGVRIKSPADYENFWTRDEIDRFFSEAIAYYIDPEKCQACMICARRCPEDAIVGGKNQIHVVDQDKCIKCNTCFDVCPPRFNAVTKISGRPVPPPLAEDKRTLVTRVKEKQITVN
jgi:F420-non-reducing hydrogenase iron-sulfur subunit